MRGLTSSRPGRVDFHAWEHYRGMVEGELIFVLRTGPTTGIIVPKRQFSSETERQHFRQLVQQNIIKPAIPLSVGFPVIQ